ncbi:kinase-like protein [Marasmius fiardii PR-910]|nr:kinase-like protein [Marasmius fiardii PR-910]
MRFLHLLVKKHNILPASLFEKDGICTLIDLDPETVDIVLAALEPSKIPWVLDLLLAEVKSQTKNQEYDKKCKDFLCHLVKNLFGEDAICTVLVNIAPETADAVLSALEPSMVSRVLDLLLLEAKSPDLDYEYHQRCIKSLCLLVQNHKVVPSKDGIHTLVGLDSEALNTILSALQPATVSSVLDLLLKEGKSPNSDLNYCQKCMSVLGLVIRKHDIMPPALSTQDGIHTLVTLVDVDSETADIILSNLKPLGVSSVFDLFLAEVKSPNLDLGDRQKYLMFLQVLVKKHKIIPPSLFGQDSICSLVDLDPGTPDSILFAVESSKIPPILDLLLAEAKTSKLNHDYRRKCRKWLRLLMNRYHDFPPSLFLKEVNIPVMRIEGAGGHADVYKGVFESKSVCLKVLKVYIADGEEKRNKDLREFYKETLLWTELNHSNLLPFLGINTTLIPGKLALVAPWMANGEVTKFLKVNPSHDRLKVISQIAAGIMYLHSRNLVHGDIKGANVLVDEQGQCYLADFGLATAAMTSTLLSTATNSAGKGTARWMAPELFTFEEIPKPDIIKLARDIYAYACTVYEIVAEKIPFAHLKHDPQVMFQVLSGKRPGRPTDTAWCPNNIWALVEQCWAQESSLRPTASVIQEFLSHLEQIREEGLPWEQKFLDSAQVDT